jgi:CheY-like chemotaxis protein
MPKKKSVKVLIVGDGPQIAGIVAEQKPLLNHKFIKASNGDEALQIASKQSPFDLLLIDIMTPRTIGLEFTRVFTNLYPNTNVLYIIN